MMVGSLRSRIFSRFAIILSMKNDLDVIFRTNRLLNLIIKGAKSLCILTRMSIRSQRFSIWWILSLHIFTDLIYYDIYKIIFNTKCKYRMSYEKKRNPSHLCRKEISTKHTFNTPSGKTNLSSIFHAENTLHIGRTLHSENERDTTPNFCTFRDVEAQEDS